MRTKTLWFASASAGISGLLHLASPIWGGFNSETIQLIVFGIFWLAVAYWLRREARWFAWVIFFVALGGFIASLAWSLDNLSAPSWLYQAITLADLVTAAMLFLYLWRAKPKEAGV